MNRANQGDVVSDVVSDVISDKAGIKSNVGPSVHRVMQPPSILIGSPPRKNIHPSISFPFVLKYSETRQDDPGAYHSINNAGPFFPLLGTSATTRPRALCLS